MQASGMMTLERQYRRGLIFLEEWYNELMVDVIRRVKRGEMQGETEEIRLYLLQEGGEEFGPLLARMWDCAIDCARMEEDGHEVVPFYGR